MADLPPGMVQGNRHPVPHFDKAEYLYRRVPHGLWDDDAIGLPIDVDAIEMPDMSVSRSKFAHPEWLRLASGCDDWGVVGFQVKDGSAWDPGNKKRPTEETFRGPSSFFRFSAENRFSSLATVSGTSRAG